MVKRFEEDKLVLATTNKGKQREILDILQGFDLEIIFADNLRMTEPEETGTTFCENALIKARAYHDNTGLAVLSDDSGLVIPQLSGRPGVNSGRFATDVGGYPEAFKILQEQLGHKENVHAYFECCLTLMWPEGHTEFFNGKVEGTLVFPGQGTQGHGYDPIFKPFGSEKTFGEMSLSEKQKLSHRGLALQKMLKACFL
jgi:XTP/dITP diphosphohydrolase